VAFAANYGPKGQARIRAWFAEDGFVEGRNLLLTFVDINGAPASDAERRAREVVADRPDVITTPGGDAMFIWRPESTSRSSGRLRRRRRSSSSSRSSRSPFLHPRASTP
jgi:hypothetical protein